MRHRVVHTSFQTWTTTNIMKQQEEQRSKRAMKKWTMTTEHRTWLTWKEEVRRRKRYYEMVNKVMRRMKRMHVTKSFGKWMEEVDIRVHLRQRMVRERERRRKSESVYTEEEEEVFCLILFFSS